MHQLSKLGAKLPKRLDRRTCQEPVALVDIRWSVLFRQHFGRLHSPARDFERTFRSRTIFEGNFLLAAKRSSIHFLNIDDVDIGYSRRLLRGSEIWRS